MRHPAATATELPVASKCAATSRNRLPVSMPWQRAQSRMRTQHYAQFVARAAPILDRLAEDERIAADWVAGLRAADAGIDYKIDVCLAKVAAISTRTCVSGNSKGRQMTEFFSCSTGKYEPASGES